MEQKPDNIQNTNSVDVIHDKKSTRLPVIALLLNIIPFILFLGQPDVILLILISVFPFAGFIVGIVALCYKKERIGKQGVIISIIAIAWPLVFIITVLLFDATGSLTMNM